VLTASLYLSYGKYDIIKNIRVKNENNSILNILFNKISNNNGWNFSPNIIIAKIEKE